jgi:pyruvate dehydrogenase E1 component
VNLVASGAVVPEAVAGAALLAAEGVVAHVIDVTSMGRLYAGWRTPLLAAARAGTAPAADHHLARLLPEADQSAPIVTVHDAASHALAWVGSVFGAPVVPVGVDAFGQSGSIPELYGVFDLLPEQLVNAALIAISGSSPPRR